MQKADELGINNTKPFFHTVDQFLNPRVGPTIAFLGLSRVESHTTPILKQHCADILENMGLLGPRLPRGNFTTVSGGYKEGMTKTSWEIGRQLGQGSVIVMPLVGEPNMVADARENA
eukprot:4884101-Pyramimonas_sp.AAC.1